VEVQPTFHKNISRKITQKIRYVYAREGSSGTSYAYVLAPSDMGASFFHYGLLYLGIKMSYDTIALNCLIIPIGKLMNIPGIKVIQAIVVRKHEGARYIKAEIQSRLGAPFNKIPLKICIIQAGSVNEREMDMYDQFSEIFSFDEEPKAEHFHITVYPK
jgi:hypothetical protein